MSSHRKDRTNEDIKREIAAIIRDMKDPRIPIVTTVTSVKVTPDLKYAKVFISILDDEEKTKAAMQSLKTAAGFIRHSLSQKLNIRNTPELTFVLDTSMAYGAHISQILNEIKTDDE